MSLHSDKIAYETEDAAAVPPVRQQNVGYELTLRVAPLEQVVPHEHYHGRRVAELAARLAADGRLINPPVVAQHGEKYVVLDGATRLTALRQLGYSCIIVQVVNLAQQQVQLTSWNHAIYGGSGTALLELLSGVPGLRLTPMPKEFPRNWEISSGVLAHLMLANKESYKLEMASTASTIEEWLRIFNAVVELYGQWGNIERTLSNDVEALASQFPNLAGLVIFPHFTPQTILELADQGRTVPAGITRFVIPGRILRLNAPLAKLAADEPLAAKQAWLDDLIRTKVLGRQVRFYEEPVVLLDE